MLKRSNEIKLLTIAAAVFAIRWFLFAIAKSPDLVIFIQVLHGLSFGLLYIAAVSYIYRISPAELKGSGMGLMVTFFLGDSRNNGFACRWSDNRGFGVAYNVLYICCCLFICCCCAHGFDKNTGNLIF
ncbi:MFS transporter [Peptococcaceae bacterium]|nr:MFS transporter [Peptococcaceae bacterium]